MGTNRVLQPGDDDMPAAKLEDRVDREDDLLRLGGRRDDASTWVIVKPQRSYPDTGLTSEAEWLIGPIRVKRR